MGTGHFVVFLLGFLLSIPYDAYAAQTSICEGNSNGSSSQCSEEVPEGVNCPIDTKGVLYMPYPGRCDKFLQCFDGRLYVQSCPDGLHWDNKFKICDWPKRAQCLPAEDKSTIEEGECNSNESSSKTTLIADPTDCSSFYICQGGRKFASKCPDGLHFNVKSSRCDYPAAAKCELTSSRPPVRWSICSADGYETKGFPKICSKYIQCVNGLVYVRSCPKGLFWSDSEKQCDYAYKSECMNGHSFLSPEGNNGEVTYVPKCPHVLDGDAFVAYPSDCTKYFQCWNGNAYLRRCPAGLHWNKESNRCDWPIKANCSEIFPTTPATSNTTEVSTTQANQNEINTTVSATNKPSEPSYAPTTDATVASTEIPGVPESSWTTEKSFESTEYPATEIPQEPSNPTTTGSPTVPTEWPTAESTEEPEVDSTPNQATDSSPDTTVETTIAPTTIVPTEPNEIPATDITTEITEELTTPQPTLPPRPPGTQPPGPEIPTSTTDPRINVSIPSFTSAPQISHRTSNQLQTPQISLTFVQSRFCPPETDTKPTVKFGDTENPSQYYECENGIPQLRRCAEGQEWSEILEDCDWPRLASIVSSAHLTSVGCTSFLQRLGDTDILVTCPSGLFWNQELLACDVSANSDCLGEQSTDYNICPNPLDQQHVPDSIRFADPNNCQKFVQCKEGFAYHLECPTGLLWNNRLGHCDWAEYVRC